MHLKAKDHQVVVAVVVACSMHAMLFLLTAMTAMRSKSSVCWETHSNGPNKAMKPGGPAKVGLQRPRVGELRMKNFKQPTCRNALSHI